MSGSVYSSAIASILLQLAEAATQDLSDLSSLILPPGWSPISAITTSGTASMPGSQGFYAQGQLGGTSVAVLALGVPWQEMYNNLYSTGLDLSQAPPAGVVPSVDSTYFEVTAGSLYSTALRTAVWSGLPQMPLYVTGKGPGAPIAQLASLDLRPGNTGPGGLQAPSAAPVCYVFSAPLVGDPGLAAFYGASVPSSFAVTAASSSLTLDLFPVSPTTADGVATLPDNFYTPLGSIQTLSSSLPVPDDPWVERSQNYYLSALGGTPAWPPTQPASIPNPPAGFSQVTAYSFAQLCAVACTQFQQPDLPIQLSIAPFTLQTNLTSVYALQPQNPRVPAAAQIICSVFTSPKAVVIAFRGMVTWAEVLAVQGNQYQSLATFLPKVSGGYSSVSQGAIGVYTGLTAPTSKITFRQTLLQTLQSTLKSGQSLYLTGHDFGGGLATLACYDLLGQTGVPQPAALYTFGSQPVGDWVFATGFNAAFQPSYQVLRPSDFVAQVNPSSSYQQVNYPVTLSGVPPGDDDTQHAITSYIQLLNPAGFGDAYDSDVSAWQQLSL